MQFFADFQFAGNKAKGRISKLLFKENKARQFLEKQIYLTPRYSHLRLRFEIRPFALLPTNCALQFVIANCSEKFIKYFKFFERNFRILETL